MTAAADPRLSDPDPPRPARSRAPHRLSPRERQVMGRRIRGVSVKVVADDLGIATSSVAEMQSRALEKLGVGSLEEAVALSENLLELFRHETDGATPTIGARVSREDRRALRIAMAAIARGLASAVAVLDRVAEGGSE